MGRSPCCDKERVRRGTWSSEEDAILTSYVERHGPVTNWIALPPKIGINRCGKSCRLRWLNYLRPNIKHGGFSKEEDNIISNLYFTMGSRWSIIAGHLPGRTDNDIKNYWNTKLKRKFLGKKTKIRRRRLSFAGSHETGLYLDHHHNNTNYNHHNYPKENINPSNSTAFTITNGHLMSSNWTQPTTTAACRLLNQDINFGEKSPSSMMSYTVTTTYNQHGLIVNIHHPIINEGSSSSRQANINNASGPNLDTYLTELEELLFSNSPSQNAGGPNLMARDHDKEIVKSYNTTSFASGSTDTSFGENMESWDWGDLCSLISIPSLMDELNF